MKAAWLWSLIVLGLALHGAAVAQVPDRAFESETAAATCDPVCQTGPCYSLRAVAVNGVALPPTNCVDAEPGDLIDAEIMVSNWSSLMPPYGYGLQVFQATLDALTPNLFAPGGTILPLGWDAPVSDTPALCWNTDDCPDEYPDCQGSTSFYYGLCQGLHHDPRPGFFINANRPDFLFYGRFPIQIFTATPSLESYLAVVVLDLDGLPGVFDPGVPLYAASLRLVVSEDACGTFTYLFSRDVGVQVMSNFNFTEPPITLHDLSINVDCDCNDDGMRDLDAIAAGVSKDCNGNGKPDDCDITEGSPDVNGDGIPDHCKRSRVREIDE